jgi:asparagine synthase (glutamine-hydrolysing)
MPRRLEYCAIQAQTHQAEYRYPLLDKRLVEFYLSLPSSMKFRNGYGRYILRKATEGILPPEIQWRTDKTGVVVPSIFLRWKQDEKAIRDLILRAKESNIKHYVDYDKMLDMLEKIVHRDTGSRERVNPQAFQSSVMLLLYQLNE